MVLAKQIRAMKSHAHFSSVSLLVSVQCSVGSGYWDYKYSDGSTIGELRDNQRNGHGTLTTVMGMFMLVSSG